MKALSANVTKTLLTKARLVCADNSGAKILQIISVRGFKGKRGTLPHAGVAQQVNVRVYRGNEKVRKQVHKAIIVRQKKEFRRPDGMRVHFEDNAAVLIDDKGDPKGTMIKGPIAKEVVERFPVVGKIATIVV
ncbi:MAG: 50S ribosomal protein L14 [Candidatus Aenigmarchaeota archaeon]|nr:50S ribosomal protein L14 [Candidatus Aenigmarchaeota archaeon]